MADDRKAFVTVQFTHEARDILRRASLQLSLDLGRRVSMPDAFRVFAEVAGRHPHEVADVAREILAAGDAGQR